MRTLLLLTFITFLPVIANESVNPTEFFTRISGQYKVDLTDGEKPHEGSEYGLVMIDGTDGLLSFSFCHPEGFCDPNDQYFPLDKVNITKKVFSDSNISYEISYTEAGKLLRFSWDELGNEIALKNYQYIIKGKLVTLEHRIHKRVDSVITQISAPDFFNSMTGNYSVTKVQGEVPHSESMGRIEIIDNEGCISFSYCSPEGACYPNDQYFSLDKTSIQSTRTESSVLYELTATDENAIRKYTLKENNGMYTLTNYQFELDGKKITLEHEAKKISDN